MASKSIICLSTLLFMLVQFHSTNAIVKGGYWPYYSSVQASNIDTTLFTHLFCAFVHIDTQTYQLTIPSECSTFARSVRQKNPSIKALLSIGGGNVASSVFNGMASQQSSRKAFIDSSISLAQSNGYDGLDLDWENQATADEMNNLAALLREWRAAINAQPTKLLLTAALNFRPQANSVVTFPTQAIATNLDWVNVMAYDFYSPDRSLTMTRAHAALRDPSSTVSGSSGITAWINAGVPANKLVLGLPFYGYSWKLQDPNNHGILAPANGKDTTINSEATPRYIDIKNFISQKGATVVYNSSYVANYVYSGTTWIGYDDTQTISTKVAYAKNTAKLLGYFGWNIDQDSNFALSRQASQTWGA